MNMGHPRLLVGEPILLIHAQRTASHCHLRRGNENDGFKMTALESSVMHIRQI